MEYDPGIHIKQEIITNSSFLLHQKLCQLTLAFYILVSFLQWQDVDLVATIPTPKELSIVVMRQSPLGRICLLVTDVFPRYPLLQLADARRNAETKNRADNKRGSDSGARSGKRGRVE